MTQRRVPATLFRGGTSKGAYFRREAMPGPREAWDDALLALYGSPDPMQIDGIGGSHSTTSKTMIAAPGEDPGVDVDYTFAQVGVEKPVVDWGGNCGNLTFAVGSFALEAGVVSADPDGAGQAELVLYNENTDSVIEQSVPVDAGGNPRYRGDFTVHGVPGTGARIRSRFLDPGGSTADALLPTGTRTDVLDVDGVGELEVSLVDATNPCVFARAADLGMTATERPAEVDADGDLLDRLERVRSAACERYGFVDDAAAATGESPGIPKMAVVGERRSYETVAGDRVDADEYDLLARIMSMQKAHHAYAVTGAMCTAVAAALPGTIPSEFLDEEDPDEVVLGHPKGTMTVGVDVDADAEEVAHTRVDRTARKIMDGDLFYQPRE